MDSAFTCFYNLHYIREKSRDTIRCNVPPVPAKKFLLPRVHKEQAPHLRWEQLEPGVVDALSLQKMFKDWL